MVGSGSWRAFYNSLLNTAVSVYGVPVLPTHVVACGVHIGVSRTSSLLLLQELNVLSCGYLVWVGVGVRGEGRGERVV